MLRTRRHRRRDGRPVGRVLLLVSVVAVAVAVLAPAAQAAPTLTVTKTATPDTATEVKPGDTITYSVELENTATGDPATDTALNPVFTDATPANTSYVADSAKDETGATITGTTNPFESGYDLPDMAPGDPPFTLTFEVTVNSPLADETVITNTAELAADNHADVTDTYTHTVDSAPALKVTASAVPEPGTKVTTGSQITFTAQVSNEASATDSAKTVVYKDPTPAGTTYVAGSSTLDGAAVPDASNPFESGYALGDMAPGTSKTLSYKVTVNEGTTSISRTVTVTAANAPAAVTASTAHTAGPAAAAPVAEPRRGTGGGRSGGGGGGGAGGGGAGLAGVGAGALESTGAAAGSAEADLASTGAEDTTPLLLIALTLFLAGWTLITRGRALERQAQVVWDEARVRTSRIMTRDPSTGPWFFSTRRR